MYKTLFFTGLFFCFSCSGESNTTYLYCSIDLKKLSSFDLLINYKKKSDNSYLAGFPKRKAPYYTRLNDNILSLSSVISQGVEEKFYREIFEIYSLNLKANTKSSFKPG